MSGSDRELEEGQIPTVTVPNDGSFLTKFLKGDIARADTDAATRSLDDAYQPAPGNEGPEPPKAEGAAPAPALAAAPPKPAKPPAVLKSKRSVLAKRLPPGAQLPAKKKAKEKASSGDGKGNSGAEESGGQKKSFYLQEMERYRQQTCDKTGGDRPLVK